MDEKNDSDNRLVEKVRSKESRKIRAQNEGERSTWFGLGMFGLVGWSVAIPTLAGILVGMWADSVWPSRYSWTLMGLTTGVIIGCLNAWYWIKKESRHD